MHLLQGLKRLLFSSLLLTAATAGAQAAEKFQVITTFTVIADMAKNVAGTPQKSLPSPNRALKSMSISRRPATSSARRRRS
jgi:manganese/iron transport system substrate-binding protein